jgi:G6PDH family F420-dependent oxidoreductase
MRFGYKLCSEERSPEDLVDDAIGAERAGFDFAAISDHFHPWLDVQGHSGHAWAVLGAIAASTRRIDVGTFVSCPTRRQHPAIVAQAAATVAALMPGRFFLGVGTGEWLNEHVVGGEWPDADDRRRDLADAIGIIRELWTGGEVTRRGRELQVDRARLYSLPDAPPPLLVAASGTDSAELAGRLGDGLITTAPEARTVRAYLDAASRGPGRVIGELTVLWGPGDEPGDEEASLREVVRRWPLPGIEGEATVELATPDGFAAVGASLGPDDVRGKVVTGTDPADYVEATRPFVDAGFTDLCIHQIGSDQEAFRTAAEERILPALREEFGPRAAASRSAATGVA